MGVKIEFNWECPACRQDSGPPPTVEMDDVYDCEVCGVRLNVLGKFQDAEWTRLKVWVETEESVRARLNAQRDAEVTP